MFRTYLLCILLLGATAAQAARDPFLSAAGLEVVMDCGEAWGARDLAQFDRRLREIKRDLLKIPMKKQELRKELLRQQKWILLTLEIRELKEAYISAFVAGRKAEASLKRIELLAQQLRMKWLEETRNFAALPYDQDPYRALFGPGELGQRNASIKAIFDDFYLQNQMMPTSQKEGVFDLIRQAQVLWKLADAYVYLPSAARSARELAAQETTNAGRAIFKYLETQKLPALDAYDLQAPVEVILKDLSQMRLYRGRDVLKILNLRFGSGTGKFADAQALAATGIIGDGESIVLSFKDGYGLVSFRGGHDKFERRGGLAYYGLPAVISSEVPTALANGKGYVMKTRVFGSGRLRTEEYTVYASLPPGGLDGAAARAQLQRMGIAAKLFDDGISSDVLKE